MHSSFHKSAAGAGDLVERMNALTSTDLADFISAQKAEQEEQRAIEEEEALHEETRGRRALPDTPIKGLWRIIKDSSRTSQQSGACPGGRSRYRHIRPRRSAHIPYSHIPCWMLAA